MVGTLDEQDFAEITMEAERDGVRLEVIGERPVWELFPSIVHQRLIDRIRGTIRPLGGDGGGCGCFHYADVSIQLPDGSRRRPDIAIYCEDPPDTRQSTLVVPVAVIEILSPRGEWKDLDVGPPNYLNNGVREVIVVNPDLPDAIWFRRGSTERVPRGQRLTLDCGCSVVL